MPIKEIEPDDCSGHHLGKSSPPCGNVKKGKAKIGFWTKKEFENVITNINVNDYYQFFLPICIWPLFMTSMRVGEATALQWSDLDFDSGLLDIHKNLYCRNQSYYQFVDPKTPAGYRRIALDADTMLFLKEWHTQTANGLHSQLQQFATQKYTISSAIDRYAKNAGVHRITVHALRHSHRPCLSIWGRTR